MRELHNIAQVNSTGVSVCIDNFNQHKDEAAERLLAQSLSYAMVQVAHLSREMILLALDLEERAAKQLS